MAHTTNRPDIFKYLDFRKYLEEYRRIRKETDPGFTHMYICHRLGQRNSKSYFSNVTTGVKPVTSEFINRFIDLLELNSDEGKYFRALVNYNQTYNAKEKEYYLDQLIGQNAAQGRLISKNEYAFYKEWYHSVIRAILDIRNFRDNYAELAALITPRVHLRQVRKSIHLLESLNLIKKNERGFYKPTDKTVKTEEYARDEMITQYQLKCLEMAKEAVLNKGDQPQDVSTNILSISEDGLRKIQRRLQKFRDEIRSLVQSDTAEADRVYQLDIQLFPNSKIHNRGGSTRKMWTV
jgi:uncharacterized protein (TIGR02147 family)